jgi:hypothetical protein
LRSNHFPIAYLSASSAFDEAVRRADNRFKRHTANVHTS